MIIEATMSSQASHLRPDQFRRDHTVPETRALVMERVAPQAGLIVTILGTGNEEFAYEVITSDESIEKVPIEKDMARIAIIGDVRGKDNAIGRLYELTNEEEQKLAQGAEEDPSLQDDSQEPLGLRVSDTIN